MSRVAIKESILRWSIDRAGLTPEKLQRKFPKIQQWFTGELQPTLRQLESLAKATMIIILVLIGYTVSPAGARRH